MFVAVLVAVRRSGSNRDNVVGLGLSFQALELVEKLGFTATADILAAIVLLATRITGGCCHRLAAESRRVRW